MKYANEYQKRYLNYHRLYTAKNVTRIDVYDDGKVIVVQKIIKRQQCSKSSTNIVGYC